MKRLIQTKGQVPSLFLPNRPKSLPFNTLFLGRRRKPNEAAQTFRNPLPDDAHITVYQDMRRAGLSDTYHDQISQSDMVIKCFGFLIVGIHQP